MNSGTLPIGRKCHPFNLCLTSQYSEIAKKTKATNKKNPNPV